MASIPLDISLPYKTRHISPGTIARLHQLLDPILKESTAGAERLTTEVLEKIIKRIELEKATIDRQADSPELSYALGASLQDFRAFHRQSITPRDDLTPRAALMPRILHPGDPAYEQTVRALVRYNNAPANHPVTIPGLLLVHASPASINYINASYAPLTDIMTVTEAVLNMPEELSAALRGHELGHKGQALKVGYTTAYFDSMEHAQKVAPNLIGECQAVGISETRIAGLLNGGIERMLSAARKVPRKTDVGPSPAPINPHHTPSMAFLERKLGLLACIDDISKVWQGQQKVKREVASANLALGTWREADADKAAVAAVGGLDTAIMHLQAAHYHRDSLDRHSSSDPHASSRDRIRAAGYEVSRTTGGDPDSRGDYVLTNIATGERTTIAVSDLMAPRIPLVPEARKLPEGRSPGRTATF